jgi:hypothetical protein
MIWLTVRWPDAPLGRARSFPVRVQRWFSWPDASDQEWPDALSVQSPSGKHHRATSAMSEHWNSVRRTSSPSPTPTSGQGIEPRPSLCVMTGCGVRVRSRVRYLRNSSFLSPTSPPFLPTANHQVYHHCARVLAFFTRIFKSVSTH